MADDDEQKKLTELQDLFNSIGGTIMAIIGTN